MAHSQHYVSSSSDPPANGHGRGSSHESPRTEVYVPVRRPWDPQTPQNRIVHPPHGTNSSIPILYYSSMNNHASSSRINAPSQGPPPLPHNPSYPQASAPNATYLNCANLAIHNETQPPINSYERLHRDARRTPSTTRPYDGVVAIRRDGDVFSAQTTRGPGGVSPYDAVGYIRRDGQVYYVQDSRDNRRGSAL